MATFDTSRTTYGSAPVASRFFGMINAAVAAVVAWNDARVTRNALASLTDRELEDIGLSRADIDAVADSRINR
ncbi:hypothetical protein So717_32350 [Roseobacter cerasinus]|uniref:YjiS-like domain-containing protein n=1 Tax=Roseobacter cerasinus TaxID=2602289 RepID=A0A640VUZ2_9RHOB|nr:DUF1127 domain-containing protein [Roseobacter cerasinus]GFE51482.1 hypothetical protein So717_32350 [Roseobacter cerasinus]